MFSNPRCGGFLYTPLTNVCVFLCQALCDCLKPCEFDLPLTNIGASAGTLKVWPFPSSC